jgi:anti-anti-sigma factor
VVSTLQFLAMSAEPLVIDRFHGGGHNQDVLCLKGPLTLYTHSSLQNAVRTEAASTVILDLAEVPYVDSSGLGALVSAHVSLHKSGKHLVLSGVNSRILKLFEITRVDSLFLIFPTLDEAIDTLSNSANA